MSKSRDVSPEFIDLLEAACDGTLAERRIAELEKHLANNDANQQLFIEYFRLDAELSAHCQNQKALEVVRRIEAEQLSTGLSLAKRWRQAKQLVTQPTPLSLSVAALVMCLIVTTMAFMVPPFYRAIANRNNAEQLDPQRVVAELTGLHQAVWADEQFAAREGTFLVTGRTLELKSGLAQVAFDSGAKMIVAGPARFTIATENAAELDFGRVTAHVPQPATGFALTTPTASVVDLGTEFHLAVDGRGNENLHVFDGVVQVTATASQASRVSQEVRAGQAVAWTNAGSIQPNATVAGERFAVLAGRLNPDTTVLFYDNFNATDTDNFDAAPLAGRLGGLLSNEVILRSARTQQQIADNRLQMVVGPTGSGRVRFQGVDRPGWYDWAAGSAATAILDADTLRLDFVWTAPDTISSDWISISIGHTGPHHGEPVMRVTDSETDYGILLRGNGHTQRFDNGAATITNSFSPTLNRQHVVIELQFDSFADGSDVDVTVKVAGKPVDHHTFTWDNNDGQLYLELGTLQTGMLIDNLRLVALSGEKSPSATDISE